MSVFMLLALGSGDSPMPQPVPKAVVAQLFGSGLPKPVLMALAVGLHLGYDGVFGVVLARIARPVTIGRGLALGVGLWVLMQVAFLPFLEWGLFGMAITPKIGLPHSSCTRVRWRARLGARPRYSVADGSVDDNCRLRRIR